MFACCLPFLYKPAAAVLSVEVSSQRLPSQRLPSQQLPSQQLPSQLPSENLLIKTPLEIPVKQAPAEDSSPVCDVPRVVRIQRLRIPDSLMDIRNPSIKARFKEFCKENTLCVACSYTNPENPTLLVFNGVLYECPRCDSDTESP